MTQPDGSDAPSNLLEARPVRLLGRVTATKKISARRSSATWTVNGQVVVAQAGVKEKVALDLTTPGPHRISLTITSRRNTTTCVFAPTGTPMAEFVVWPLVSGTVLDEAGAGVAAATVQAMPLDAGATAASDGSYRFFVPFGWSGEANAAHPGYDFSSAARTAADVRADLRWDFSGTLVGVPPECLVDADCEDGLYCNGAEICAAGQCVTGTPINCDDGVPCTTDSCSDEQRACVNPADDTACDDGLFCNGTETCDTSLGCTSAPDPCLGRYCDEPTQACLDCLLDDECDDELFCNGAETCDTGSCAAGSVPCLDGDVCSEADRQCMTSEPVADQWIRRGDAWTFARGDVAPPPSWAALGFDEAAWNSGPAGIGYSTDLVYPTALDDMYGQYASFYVRRDFVVTEPDQHQILELALTYDDGFVAYVNGTEVARSANLTGTVTNTTLTSSGHDEESPEETYRFSAGPALLHPGRNVLAIEIHNTLLTSSDAGFDARLTSASGCSFDSDCDDGLFCNGQERCELSTCVSGSPVDCDDGVACTLDTCNNATNACDLQPSDALCDDGVFCNGAETCDAQLDCTAGGDPCQGRQCDLVADTCADCLDDVECDDGVDCNGFETCAQGRCVAGVDQCPQDFTCDATLDQCEAVDLTLWTPPIGIPAPSFGIHEVAPPVPNPWLVETPGFYYVDRYHPGATDANALGTPAAPRASIPFVLPAGAVVELHGRYDYHHTSPRKISGTGSPSAPIFIRGASAADMPLITQGWDIKGSYLILENLRFADDDGDLNDNSTVGRPMFVHPAHHAVLRHSDVSGNSTRGGVDVKTVNDASQSCHDIVVYNNTIHDNGDWQANYDQDRHGIKVENNAFNLWVLDNEMYHNSGDGIQIGGTQTTHRPHHIYVGRNVSWQNKQVGFWTKTADDVIFSQNIAHSHAPSGSSPGAGMGWQYDGHRIWFLFNEVYGNQLGIRGASPNQGGTQDVYLVGNIVRNSPSWAFETWSSQPDLVVVNNTFHDTGGGISITNHRAGIDISSNIITNLRSRSQIAISNSYGW